MTILLKLIHDYSSWLYVASAITALVLLRLAILTRRERLQSSFSLEREVARSKEWRIMAGAIVILLFLGGVYAVDRYVIPTVDIPYEVGQASPTAIYIPTITPTPAPPTATPTRTPTIIRPTEPVVEITPTPAVTATPIPVAPACPNPGVRFTSPGMGAQVSGVVRVAGTAAIDNFQFYKVELGVGDRPQDWSFLFSGNSTVNGGVLGNWDTSHLSPGIYSLRLVVVDNTGNYPEPCRTSVSVER